MRKIAFLCAENYSELLQASPCFLDLFQILAPVLKKLGYELVQVNWQNPQIIWEQFEFLLPLGCWNYIQHAQDFYQFIENMKKRNIPLRNPASIILWNMRKTYLQDLKAAGLSVAELLLIPEKNIFDLEKIKPALETMGKINNGQLIAKTSVGSGAYDVIRFDLKNIAHFTKTFEKILSHADLILQPFFSEVVTEGEYSFFFFNNQFSHAILKQPAPKDFRAHPRFSAKITPYLPVSTEIQAAAKFLSTLKTACSYARVDVFRRNNTFHLLELELLEPYLYFEYANKTAVDMFCQSIIKDSPCAPVQYQT